MKDKILELLMLQPFTNRKDLRQALSANGFYVSDRIMRATIEELVEKDHF